MVIVDTPPPASYARTVSTADPLYNSGAKSTSDQTTANTIIVIGDANKDSLDDSDVTKLNDNDSKLAVIVIGVPFIAVFVVVLLVIMVMRENWEGY